MSKPRGVRWLEQETCQHLDREAVSGDEGRHLSLRIPNWLSAQLDALAAERNESVSQTARRLLNDAIARVNDPAREAIDTAIAALEKLRRPNNPSAA